MKYRVEQVTARHIPRYSNVRPRDIGLWIYIIDDRAYGFTRSKETAIHRAQAGVGTI